MHTAGDSVCTVCLHISSCSINATWSGCRRPSTQKNTELYVQAASEDCELWLHLPRLSLSRLHHADKSLAASHVGVQSNCDTHTNRPQSAPYLWMLMGWRQKAGSKGLHSCLTMAWGRFCIHACKNEITLKVCKATASTASWRIAWRCCSHERSFRSGNKGCVQEDRIALNDHFVVIQLCKRSVKRKRKII